MPKLLANPTPRSRYSYERIVDEISQVIASLPRGTTARLSRELGLETHQFSHRLRGVKSKFTAEQVGVIADKIVPGGAPMAWPYYPWAVCEALQGRAVGLSGRGVQPAERTSPARRDGASGRTQKRSSSTRRKTR